MAKISDKNINELSDWNMKELRKLKINTQNRINSLKVNDKKDLSEKNLLFGLEISELETLITKIKRAEKKLSEA